MENFETNKLLMNKQWSGDVGMCVIVGLTVNTLQLLAYAR